MTGPEHFAEAQWLLAQVTTPSATSPDHRVLLASEFPGDSSADVIALAQVHATLALAAATALNDAMDGTTTEDWNAWRAVASLTDPPKGTS